MDTTDTGFQALALLRFEGLQLRSPSITRATFYEGKPPLGYIKTKLAEIINENSWLQGRLSKYNGRLVLRYPKRSRGVGQSLRVMNAPTLRFDMGFAELAEVIKEHVVKRGTLCVDKDEDLFRVVVAEISDGRFALVTSMSHVYADGHTFYEIYKMLSTSEPARPMIAERVLGSRAAMNAMMRGGDDALPWLGSPGFIVNAIGSLVARRTATLNLFNVNQEVIAGRKREYLATHDAGFISTNDIITADFFSKTACDLVFMTINFRDRIPSLTSAHAGNYECVMAYQRADYGRPDLIRRALSDYRRAISGRLPGFFKSTRVKLGAITSLAALYQDVALPECVLEFHRPVVSAASFFPMEHTIYVFKARQDQLAILACCKETSVLANIEFLGQRIV